MPDGGNGRHVLKMGVGKDGAVFENALESAGILGMESRQIVVAKLIDDDGDEHQLGFPWRRSLRSQQREEGGTEQESNCAWTLQSSKQCCGRRCPLPHGRGSEPRPSGVGQGRTPTRRLKPSCKLKLAPPRGPSRLPVRVIRSVFFASRTFARFELLLLRTFATSPGSTSAGELASNSWRESCH